MACFTCGKSFTGDVNLQLSNYKKEFEEKGIKRVYYKTSKDGDIHVSHAEPFFKHTHKKLTSKKAIKDGAEFALIQEFGQTSDSNVLGDNKE